MAQVKDQIELVNHREQEIIQLTKSINDLAMIFREMQTLVIEQVRGCGKKGGGGGRGCRTTTNVPSRGVNRPTPFCCVPNLFIVFLLAGQRPCLSLVPVQGTIVDRIDYNIQQTVILTHEAHKELVEGNKQQKKYRTKLCILLLVAVVVALVLALAFKPKSQTESPTAAPTSTSPTTPAPTVAREARDADALSALLGLVQHSASALLRS